MSNMLKPGNLDSNYFRNIPGIWLKRTLYFFPAVLVCVLFLISIFWPSELKRDSRQSVVIPVSSEDKGFVGKSNRLLSELLAVEDNTIRVTSIESLNRRYPAFEFDLPYDEISGSNVTDVRIVAIHPEYIKDADMKNFYYNSMLSSLLKKQRENMMDKYFTINFKREKVGVRQYESHISKIYLKKDMFKVALEKDPWRGTVLSAPNSLFDDGNSLYLVHKDMAVPLSKVSHVMYLNAFTTIFALNDETFYDAKGSLLDYYRYYKAAFRSNPKHLRIDVREKVRGDSKGWLDIAYLGDESAQLQILPNKDLVCRIATPGEDMLTINSSELANAVGKKLPYKEGMRILLYDRKGVKVTEFALVSENPMRILSTMRYTAEGLSRYWADGKNADILTRQLTKGVGRNMSNILGVDTVQLSTDPLLSLEFEKEMKRYLSVLRTSGGFTHVLGEQYEMSMTVMDMATGQILASPSVTDNPAADDKYMMSMRNSSLVRRPIGSTFKPPLTLAAVLSNPSLLNLQNTGSKSRIIDATKKTGMFLGCKTRAWVPNHWGNNRNMTQYLGYSDDVYPVLLATLCLSGYPDSYNLATVNRIPLGSRSYFKVGTEGVVLGNKDVRLTDYELIKNLASLYSVYSFNDTDTDKSENLNYYLWENLYSGKEYISGMDRHFGLDEVSPDATNMNYDRFDGQTLRGHLVPWVLGQGDNDWSCIKMAEAWTRMLTKRPVKASFIAVEDRNEAEGEDLVDLIARQKEQNDSNMSEDDVNSIWNSFLASFRQAQSVQGGTLKPMDDAVTALNTRVRPSAGNLVVFSKTGTPDQYKRLEVMQIGRTNRYYDVAQFVFSLMSESSCRAVKNNNKAKGITCVVRITRSYPKESDGNGLWSSHARDFFSAHSEHLDSSERLDKLYYMTQKYY